MKKRQKPYLLVALLLVGVGTAVVINSPKSESRGNTPQTGEKVDVPDQKNIADTVSSSVAKTPPMTPIPHGPGGMMRSQNPAGSVVMKPKPTSYKPKPNESNTSTQWYTTETPKEIPSGN